ncbi:hypothetical protein [Paenibacillus sp. V4I5]|uniref:hypothetical protein n=1 Tax=Paenibacillus sp. V4I5 TaxID=3042306 RepID=UPI002792860D|nr:hypothetical protein [Paenibacillus sp. V4I5]MDQ0914592.1 hypothetical protein [Paenibacillus sp. V4I5]
MDYPFKQLFMRKIISAAIATFFFSIIYAWLKPDLFGAKSIYSIGDHSHEAFGMINIYMMYAAPAIYIYGISTSLISELIARVVTHRQWLRLAVSTIFHCGFGLILLYISLLASLLFLLCDTMLAINMKKPLNLKITIASPLLPLCLWFMSVAYINITG